MESLLQKKNNQNKTKFFITGTDTGVGKTYISAKLLKFYNSHSFKTIGLKPIASGGPEDALILKQASSLQLTYPEINPFLFQPPIAPHIAAQQEGKILNKNLIKKFLTQSFETLPADVFIIEGAGGWFLPLNTQELMSEVVAELNLPVILVVGMKLGCLNHALLSAQAIKNTGAHLAHWVANVLDPTMSALQENIQTLCEYLGPPLLIS